MTDNPASTELLAKILDVLTRIDEKIRNQDEQIRTLETFIQKTHSFGSDACTTDTAIDSSVILSRGDSKLDPQDEKPHQPTADKSSSEGDSAGEAIIRHDTATEKLPYTDFPWAEKGIFFCGQYITIKDYLEITGLDYEIQGKLGDWWNIPDDMRMQLTFSKHKYIKARSHSDVFLAEPLSIAYGSETMNIARQFDDSLRVRPGNDFLAVDFDEHNHSRLYRMGESAVGPPLMIERGGHKNAPWSRLIVYQGMTTGEHTNHQKESGKGLKWSSPYFRAGDENPGLWVNFDYHLRNKAKNITANPYHDPDVGFHTNFYEIMNEADVPNELWKHGPLYNDPLRRSFRKCAYTLYAPSPKSGQLGENDISIYSPRHWTILLLAPSYFFDENNTSFPMGDLSAGRKQALGHCLGRLTKLGAEMNLIGHGLQRISERWSDFQSFFEFILDSGDSLMQPAAHDNLLFDDGAFSRSRRYFWAIDCLSEFELSITDNLSQWQLFKAARVEPLILVDKLSELDFLQYKIAEKHCSILINQREYFRRKLAATRALRDALFNASAVIESRESTRLGENVKLLTFVSIFFLPLSFCTSLWSINTLFPLSLLPPVIIGIGLATYILVLNIDTLCTFISRIYNFHLKRAVLNAMKIDVSERWKSRGARFEVFRPKAEQVRPSEWWVPVYAVEHPWVCWGRRVRPDWLGRREVKSSTAGKKSAWLWWKRKNGSGKEEGEEKLEDQPWVL
ncbi:MAG: hypothetical protein MMC33_005019 [Icmadophila ericetorum]|nr:hypothetical protein [Icmadophila ericetorum]